MKKVAFVLLAVWMGNPLVSMGQEKTLWELAQANKEVFTVSTLFTASQVRDYLGSAKGIEEAMAWCRRTGVTRVFIETYRDRYQAERGTLENAKARFLEAGIRVSGCVTPTRIGKRSTGWNIISCYTDRPTQEQVQKIFEFTASIFDEIMIDDFWFTDCQCEDCKQARGEQSWADYRCNLMVRVSRERVLAPARKVNPKVKIIIKYPQWYDDFHNRGYEVVRETADFDRIWVGTETRNFEDRRWGGKVQYEAYYIMRWLGEIGGAKTGGGWFDPYGTTEETYVEQARQTILADAQEMLLFCYGSLLRQTGPANVEALRKELPGQFELARLVRGKPIKGLIAPKPPNSAAPGEMYVYDFIGMLGLPLVPTARIDPGAPGAVCAVQALKDPQFARKLQAMLKAGKPVLLTDGLAEQLKDIELPSEKVLAVKGNPKNLLKLTREELTPIRDIMLAPWGMRFEAPNKVGLYLIGEDLLVVENFNNETVEARWEYRDLKKAKPVLVLPPEEKVTVSPGGRKVGLHLPGRSLVVLRYQ